MLQIPAHTCVLHVLFFFWLCENVCILYVRTYAFFTDKNITCVQKRARTCIALLGEDAYWPRNSCDDQGFFNIHQKLIASFISFHCPASGNGS